MADDHAARMNGKVRDRIFGKGAESRRLVEEVFAEA